MKKFNTEVKVGIFVIIAAIMLLYMAKKINKYDFEDKGYYIHVLLDSAQGLVENSYVKISGVPVGRIKHIDLKDDMARIKIVLPRNVRVHEDAKVYVKMESLLGGKFVDIERGSFDSPFLQPGGEIKQAGLPPDLDRLISVLNKAAVDIKKITGVLSDVLGGEGGKESLAEILNNFREITSKVNHIINSNDKKFNKIIGNFEKFSDELPGLTKDTRKTIGNVDVITGRIKNGDGTFGKLVNDDAIYLLAKETLENIKNISSKISKGEGSAGKFVNNDELYNTSKEAVDNIKAITAKLSSGEGTVGKLLNDTKLYDELSESAETFKKIVVKIEKGEGTLGKLVNDDSLYNETQRVLRGTNRAMEAIDEQMPVSTLGVVVPWFLGR